MATWITFPILGLVEGLTEFIPISSSGHLIVAHQLLGALGPQALSVDAILQFGAVLAVIVYFRKDLLVLLYALLNTVRGRLVASEDSRLLWALSIGTVPAVILGLLLEPTMDTIFRNAHLVAYALIAGSLVMFFAEYCAKQNAREGVGGVTVTKGFLIGLFQALALVPGMSRSAMTISGGLFLGLSREASAKFGFLLSIPIILGSGGKKFFELSHSGALSGLEVPLFVGTFFAFASGLLVIHWLLKFLQSRPLHVFAVYRILLAVAILVFIPAL